MTLIGLQEISRRTTIARAGVYRLEAAGLFPQRLQLSTHRIAWLESELDDWLLSRPRAFGCLVVPCEPIVGIFVLTEKQVIAYTTIGRANIRRLADADLFPAPVRISAHKIGWLKHEIDAWIQRRPRPSQPPTPAAPILKGPPPFFDGEGSPAAPRPAR